MVYERIIAVKKSDYFVGSGRISCLCQFPKSYAILGQGLGIRTNKHAEVIPKFTHHIYLSIV